MVECEGELRGEGQRFEGNSKKSNEDMCQHTSHALSCSVETLQADSH